MDCYVRLGSDMFLAELRPSVHLRYCVDEDRGCPGAGYFGCPLGPERGRHHLVVNHAVWSEKVIYSPAIAVRRCSAEFRCAGGITYKYYCDECWDREHSYLTHTVVLLSFQDA